MSTRSKRLAGPYVLTGSADATIYTVPADRVALVKSLRVLNPPSGSARQVLLGIGTTAGSGLIAVATLSSGIQQWVDPDTDPIVLHEGETLKVSTPVATAPYPTVVISGCELVEPNG